MHAPQTLTSTLTYAKSLMSRRGLAVRGATDPAGQAFHLIVVEVQGLGFRV